MRGRFSWWYDSDGNAFHGGGGGVGGLNIDEAWVRLPALGGRWIFGRQYGGQDYETGAANPSLALGVGYYTGAALTGIRADYDITKYISATGLVQMDDNGTNLVAGGGGNVAGVARVDVDVPWWKNSAGDPRIKLGFQTVGHWANSAGIAAGGLKAFNDGTSSKEWSVGADIWVDVLKGFRAEYVNTYQDVAGNHPDNFGDNDGSAEGAAVYATLGILETPTFKLDVSGGLVEDDFNLSSSIITNPYTPVASGTFALFDRPVILARRGANTGPTQGYDINLRWMVGSRPLQLRFAGSTKKADTFNWLAYGAFPIVQTGHGDLTLSGGYIDVDAGHALRPATKGGVTAVRLSTSFAF